jgi:hypothetical protein
MRACTKARITPHPFLFDSKLDTLRGKKEQDLDQRKDRKKEQETYGNEGNW